MNDLRNGQKRFDALPFTLKYTLPRPRERVFLEVFCASPHYQRCTKTTSLLSESSFSSTEEVNALCCAASVYRNSMFLEFLHALPSQPRLQTSRPKPRENVYACEQSSPYSFFELSRSSPPRRVCIISARNKPGRSSQNEYYLRSFE